MVQVPTADKRKMQMSVHATSWAPRMPNCVHFRKAEEPEGVSVNNSTLPIEFGTCTITTVCTGSRQIRILEARP